jgi:hypothetical protein
VTSRWTAVVALAWLALAGACVVGWQGLGFPGGLLTALGASTFAVAFRGLLTLVYRALTGADNAVSAMRALPLPARLLLPAIGGLLAGLTGLAAARLPSSHGVGDVMEAAVLGRVRVSSQMHGAAPEVIRGERTDARTEVWALGVALYEAVFAEIAFPGDSDVDRLMRVLSGEPPARLRDPAGVPPALLAVLRGALAFDPAQRFASPDALAVALDPIAAVAPAPPVYRTDPRAALAAAADAQDLPRAASLLCATPELLDDGLARWLWRRLAAPLLDDLRDGRVEIHDAVLAVLLRRVIAADLRTLRADARTRLGARGLLDAICDDVDLVVPQGDRRVRLGVMEVDACARAWESLRPTDDSAVRHCDDCAQTVTEVRGVGALSAAGARCVMWRDD